LLQGMTTPLNVGFVRPTQWRESRTAAMLRILGELSDELRRSIDFYTNQGENPRSCAAITSRSKKNFAIIGQIDEFFTQRLRAYLVALIDPVEILIRDF
jgi:type IV pilus assembly protein PilM